MYNDGLMWKGLRLKMAVVYGVPNCAIDPSSGRMSYVIHFSFFSPFFFILFFIIIIIF